MRLHDYVPVTAAALYSLATPDELAAASQRAQERLQEPEAVDPLAAAYQAVLEAAGRRMASALRSKAVALTSDAEFTPPDEDEVVDSDRLAREMAEGAGEAQREAARIVVAALDDEGISFDVDTVFTDELLRGIGERATFAADAELRATYRNTIEVAAEFGWSVPETATALTNKIGDLAPYRAQALARTDLNGLANGGSVHVASVALGKGKEQAYKTWLATDDERTRESHVDADGQTVPIDDTFNVGGAALPYPGFPFGPAEEVINCRCTVTYTSDPTGATAVVTDPDAATRDPLAYVTPDDLMADAVGGAWERSDAATEHPQGFEGFKRELEAKLTDELAEDKVSIRVRTPGDIALEVAVDGRLQSQFESGRSEGALGPSMRANAEQLMFSYPENLPHEERPIYGYVGGPTAEHGSVNQYGEVTWILKNSVRERTTWTADDSLSLKFAPSPINRPSALSADPYVPVNLLRAPLSEWDSFYVEAQVHGGVTLDDVDRVEMYYHPFVNEDGIDIGKDMQEAIAAPLRQRLRGKGITVEVKPYPASAAPRFPSDERMLGGSADGLEQSLGLGDDRSGVEVGVGLTPVPASDHAERRHLDMNEPEALVEYAHLGRGETVTATLGEEHEVRLATDRDDLHETDDTPPIGGSRRMGRLRYPDANQEEHMTTAAKGTLTAEANGEVVLRDPISWDAVLCVEGLATEDGRMLERGTTSWRDLPLTLMGLIETGEYGHQGAQVSGRIDEVLRVIDEIVATGDLTTDFGIDTLAPMIADRTVRGVSVDLAVLDYEYRDAETGEKLTPEEEFEYWLEDKPTIFVSLDGVIVGATVCPMPAIANAEIALAASAQLDDRAKAMLASALEGRNVGPSDVPIIRLFTPFDRPTREGLFASAVAEFVAPPRSAFELTEFPGETPLTITERDPETGYSRVFGHIATWTTCHVGIPGVCTTAPRSGTDPAYALFHQGQYPVEGGGLVDVGKLMLGTGHASLGASRMEATRHYDKPDMVGAYVRAYDGEHGIWVSGITRPELTDAGLRELRANPPSGDWRQYNHRLELIAVCAVAVPGFPVVADAQANITAAGGEVAISALIASPGVIVPTSEVKDALLAAGCGCEDLLTDDEGVDELAELAVAD